MRYKNLLYKAKEYLQKGDVVAFPTETVYGLGASIEKEEGIDKIFSLKKRALDNPLIVHIYCLEQVPLLARMIPKDFFLLQKAFFPGPLTIILPKQKNINPRITASLDTIAFRMPQHPVALDLLRACKKPIAAPSANISGKPSPTCVAHVEQDFLGKIPLILEGSSSAIGIESTVVSLVSTPTILRPGTITQEQLENVLQKKVTILEKNTKALCPGMKYRHYAPEAKLLVYYNKEKLREDFYKEEKKSWVFSNQKIDIQGPIFSYTTQNLYTLFRKADEKNIQKIYLFLDAETNRQAGLINRILKAKEAK